MRRAVAYIDTRLQRRFDALFQWLMRRGVSKRAIRWNLYALFIVTFVLGQAIESMLNHAPWKLALAALTTVVVICMWGLVMQRDDEWDARAERKPGMRSLADEGGSAALYKTLGAVMMTPGMACIAVMPWTHRAPGATYAVQAVHAASLLALGYLCRTPPVAPDPKEKADAPLSLPLSR